jgi:hypothetical protein
MYKQQWKIVFAKIDIVSPPGNQFRDVIVLDIPASVPV